MKIVQAITWTNSIEESGEKVRDIEELDLVGLYLNKRQNDVYKKTSLHFCQFYTRILSLL